MFESILERILLNNFGKYIDKLDQQNLSLGFWSGEIKIENLELKKGIF